MRKKLLVDVDEVICFTMHNAVNEFLKTNYKIDDFTEYYIDEVAIPKDKMSQFNNFLSTYNLYENADIVPNAIEAIEKLSEEYDIYFCTSCINPFDIKNSGNIFKQKYEFLLKAFPFISPKNYIMTSSKQLIKADVIIDDVLKNLDGLCEERILFSSYHNMNITDDELNKVNAKRAGTTYRDAWNSVLEILMPGQK